MTAKLLEDTPAVLSLGKLCEDHGYSYERTAGQKPQLIKDDRRIKCNTANYAPIVVLGLSTSSSSSAAPTSPKHQYCRKQSIPHQQEVRIRAAQYGEARRMSHKKPKMETTRTSGETRCLICQNGYNNLQRILWMKVFQNTETLPVLLMNYLQSREQKWYRISTAFLLTSQRYLLENQNYKGVLGENALVQSCPERKIGDLVTADHKVVSEGSESRNNHRYAVVVQDLATQWIQSYPCKTTTSQETESSLRAVGILCGQRFGKICPMHRNAKRSKSGLSKNLSATMPEDCVVFISLILDDEEFKDIMNNARGKLENSEASRNALQTST